MSQEQIKQALIALLEEVAEKARQDALDGESDMSSIFGTPTHLRSLDEQAVAEAIANIERATRTKEGTRRLINGLMVVAKAAARVAFPS